MSNLPKVSDIYRHFKGNLYQIVAIAEHTETGEQMVVYQALYGDFRIYTRPLHMFMEPVDRAKYPNAAQKMRFELVDRKTLSHPAAGGSEPIVIEIKKTFTSKSAAAKQESSSYSDEVIEQVAPGVLQFLDADTHEERLKILRSLEQRSSRSDALTR